ncbi:chloride channel CLIC-like protein 1 [Engraulis encrasicolus]|uniref:chloride channel CLIC-like protein 1 n=1 Tax=Engraulis encrasicolus TaxID=184585 RepID=UPI002FD1F08F
MSALGQFTPERCLLIFSLFSVLLLARGQDDDWVDPFDMLNYDATSKTMRKPETANYNNVPTKRREYIQDAPQCPQCPTLQCPDVSECTKQVEKLQKELDEHKFKVTTTPQPTPSPQPLTCNPLFKRFIAKLLKEISKLGDLSSVSPGDEYYDAKVQLTARGVAELQKVVNGESWTTGSLDDALSKILVDFKRHDYEAWKWRFEDAFGVELDTVMKTLGCVVLIVVIISSELWSTVSWFVQFRRMFALCFFISIVWNWFYLYKIAFAEHQAKIVKMEKVSDKCTGVKKIDWVDSLHEWYRSTWTLQDDPCQKYYELLMVNPLLLVPPTKAISLTLTTFITEPLKHLGQGISEFLRALLKDLPITLQIPVLLTIVLSIVLCTYGSAQTAITHMLTRPLRRGRRDPPPPGIEGRPRPRPAPLAERAHSDTEEEEMGEGEEDGPRYLGAGDAPVRRRSADQGRRAGGGGGGERGGGRGGATVAAGAGGDVRERRGAVRQRTAARPMEERRRVVVETLRNADHRYSGDETDRPRTQEGEGEEDARSDQASGGGEEQGSAGEQEGLDVTPSSPTTVVKKEKEKKEKEEKKLPVNKDSPSRDSVHAEAEGASGGNGTMGAPHQLGQQRVKATPSPSPAAQTPQSPKTPERQGASASQHTPTASVQELKAQGPSSKQEAPITSGFVENIGMPVQESGQ